MTITFRQALTDNGCWAKEEEEDESFISIDVIITNFLCNYQQ